MDILTSLLTSALRPEPNYRLPVPALLLHGQRDQIGDITTSMRVWAEREPLAQYAVIPKAGHASNLDNPDHFTRLLTAFIDDVAHPAGIIDSAESSTGPMFSIARTSLTVPSPSRRRPKHCTGVTAPARGT